MKELTRQLRALMPVLQRANPIECGRCIELQPSREEWVLRRVAFRLRESGQRVHGDTDCTLVELLPNGVNIMSPSKIIRNPRCGLHAACDVVVWPEWLGCVFYRLFGTNAWGIIRTFSF